MAIALLIARTTLPKIAVDPDTGAFVECGAEGRTRLFHGLPLVFKEKSPRGQWSGDQLDLMVQWGFTAARLGFVWHLYETKQGKFNETYMDEVEELADALGARGVARIDTAVFYCALSLNRPCHAVPCCPFRFMFGEVLTFLHGKSCGLHAWFLPVVRHLCLS